MRDGEADARVQGRAAYQRRAWQSAYQLLSSADASEQQLAPDELEELAWAANWTAHYAEALDHFERAEHGYQRTGNKRGAARMALQQARLQFEQHNEAVVAGLAIRAASLLADETECAEHGLLAWTASAAAFSRSDFETVRAQAERAVEIGRRIGDRDSEALGLLWLGHYLLATGGIEEGIALHDEATAAATSGELGPFAAGAIYCSVIWGCRGRADWHRAAEWTERVNRWCERESIAFFPGLCRVHRAEILRFRGAFRQAERDALEGRDLLLAAAPRRSAMAFRELGEIRLRLGDLEGAEEACRKALEFGGDPEPVLAQLRLAQGDAKGALAAIDRALADPFEAENQANLLPTKVSIALAAGDRDSARDALAKLETLAATLDTPAPLAAAAAARGELELAEGRSKAAIEHLRSACRTWSELDDPYDAAQAQRILATAYASEGDLAAAIMEIEAALATFERLEAQLDAKRARQSLEGLAASRGDARVARQTKTFMFTDIVDSTKLVEVLGDAAWESLQRWHHRALRSCFEAHGGEEVDHAGDGFFVAFPEAGAALDCAISIQRLLAAHRDEHGFAPRVRIGVHSAEALRRGDDYVGKGIHVAARIAAQGGAGEILASRDAWAAAEARFAVTGERELQLKGLAAPVAVVRIEW